MIKAEQLEKHIKIIKKLISNNNGLLLKESIFHFNIIKYGKILGFSKNLFLKICKTIEFYAHVSTKDIGKIKIPLNALNLT